MVAGRYVGLSPPELRRLGRDLTAAANELTSLRLTIEATLASVDRSWGSDSTARGVEAWLECEARDVLHRLDELTADERLADEVKSPWLSPLGAFGLGIRRTIWPKDVRDCRELHGQIENTYVYDGKGRLRQILEDAHGWRLARDPRYLTHIEQLLGHQTHLRKLLRLWDLNACEAQGVENLPVGVRDWADRELMREIPPPLAAVHVGGVHWGHILQEVGIAAGAVATGFVVALTLPEDAAAVGIGAGATAAAKAIA